MSATILPRHAVTGVRAVGIVNGRPVYPIKGGSGENDPDPTDDPEEDEDDPEEDEDPDAGKTPEQLAAELKTMRSSLSRANRQAKNWRRKANGENGDDKGGDKGGENDGDDSRKFTKADLDAARSEVQESATRKAKDQLVAVSLDMALREAGMNLPKDPDARKAKISRARRLIDMDDIAVNDDGELEGLSDQIAELKNEYPELFAAAATNRRVGRPGGQGGNGGGANTKKDSTTLQAEALFGKGS